MRSRRFVWPVAWGLAVVAGTIAWAAWRSRLVVRQIGIRAGPVSASALVTPRHLDLTIWPTSRDDMAKNAEGEIVGIDLDGNPIDVEGGWVRACGVGPAVVYTHEMPAAVERYGSDFPVENAARPFRWVGFAYVRWQHVPAGGQPSREVFVPAWIAEAVLIGPLVALSVRRARRRWRGRGGRCRGCGYDLRATPDRCPECGAVPARRNVAST